MRAFIFSALRSLLKTLFQVKVVGDTSVFSKHKKCLIIANHESFIDGLLLILFLPIKPVFIVHYCAHRKPLIRFFLRFCEYLPIESSHPLAIKKVLKLIEEGRQVVIFPEGRVSTTGGIMKIYEGPAFIAAKSGASVIPIQFRGTSFSYFSRLSDSHPHFLFPKMTLTIFPPTHIQLLQNVSAKIRRQHAAEEMRKLMEYMAFATVDVQGSLYRHLLKAIKVFGWRRKILEDVSQGELRYASFLKMVLGLSRLVDRLTDPGQKVGILLPNLATTAALFFALSARGRIPALLNFSSGLEGLQSACVAAEVSMIFTSKQFVEKAHLEETLAGLKNVRVIYLEDLKASFTWEDKFWVLKHLFVPARIDAPNPMAAILFTSGSEGRPKGVALSHKAILSNIAQLKSVIPISVEDKLFNAMPMFHSFGLTVGTLLPLLEGVQVFLYPSPLHYRLIPEMVYDRNCTILAGTNTFLAKYAQFAHPYDFYSVRYVVSGAEKLSESTRQLWMEKFGLRILEGYGATEASPAIAANTPMGYRPNTVGQFLPGMEYQLKPVSGIDKGGLLFVKGPNLMMGYFRYEQPGLLQKTESALGLGWYETGDVVFVDAEEYVHILGRVKRFAKIAGEMLSLESAERVAHHASPEKVHAAIAVEDEHRGEQILLFTTDKHLTRQALVASVKTLGLPELLVPKRMMVMDAIPLLGTGKPDYVRLKKTAEA